MEKMGGKIKSLIKIHFTAMDNDRLSPQIFAPIKCYKVIIVKNARGFIFSP